MDADKIGAPSKADQAFARASDVARHTVEAYRQY